MIRQEVFPVEPWCLRETTLDVDLLAQSESLFTLSNGHIGLRGNLDEGEPHGLPGTYLNSFHERRSLPYAEAGYGYPEAGQTLVNVTNGKLIRLLVDDEPFDVRYGELTAHERVLDLRAGVLSRRTEWTSPSGQAIRLTTRRVVSLTQRAIAAVQFVVEPIDRPVQVVAQSELVANEKLPRPPADPRVAAELLDPLLGEDISVHDNSVTLVHSTRISGLRLAAAMDHELEGPASMAAHTQAFPDLGRTSVTARLEPGERLCLTKYISYGWSARRSLPALRDQVAAALTAARYVGWDALLAEQARTLAGFWDHADVRVEGDPELQQAVRFALFHVMQAAVRAERRPIPAKGLTGTGYDGHCFWDTETFVLPLLSYTMPHAAADALRWRQETLPAAQQRAAQLGFAGAAYPWRTIDGAECSAYWPAGTAALHINADIADAVVRHVQITGDSAFEASTGLPVLVETARLWHSVGHCDHTGAFRIDGVTGPDEYSAVADNNVFTNLMAQHNLVEAAAACERHPDEAAELEVDPSEIARWRKAAAAMAIPWDDALQVHPQAEGFTRHARLDFAALGPEDYPLMLRMPYLDLYRKQVLKQADLVLAMHLRGDAFTPAQKRRNFDYYEELTVRDSSLSACTQAVLAAEVGHLGLALDYTAEAALVDLRDLAANTRNGLHMAALAGAWIALVAGFGGLRDHAGNLSFRPRLPPGLTGLDFAVLFHGMRLRVVIRADHAQYSLGPGEHSVTLRHYDTEFTLGPDRSLSHPIVPQPEPPRPAQPPGRAPARRGRGDLGSSWWG